MPEFAFGSPLNDIGFHAINRIETRILDQLDYHPPIYLFNEAAPKLKNPDRKEKCFFEMYQAALLGYLLQASFGRKALVTIAMAKVEYSEIDCAIRAQIRNETIYRPVQLKQLPNHQQNQKIEIQEIINKVAKRYPSAPDLIVSIWINRKTSFQLKDLDFSKLGVGQLYLIGETEGGRYQLHGGAIVDLNDGQCFECIIEDLEVPRVYGRIRRFRPPQNPT